MTAQSAVAVLNHRSSQARLGAALLACAPVHGLALQLRTHAELASEVDVHQSADLLPRVDPDRPMLWLAGTASPPDDDADARFLYAETVAAARSVAMISGSAVLNRPSPTSSYARLPWITALALRRAAQFLPPGTVRPERFTTAPPDGDEVFDYSSGRTSFGAEGTGPYRSRPVRRPESTSAVRTVKVVAVGSRVVGAAVVPAGVEELTHRVMRGFELDFANVWWLVDPAGDDPVLARIDCSCWDFQLGPDVADVADALLAELATRTGEFA